MRHFWIFWYALVKSNIYITINLCSNYAAKKKKDKI